MKTPASTRPQYAILLADLIVYLLSLKACRPNIAEKAKRAIKEGHFYEQN